TTLIPGLSPDGKQIAVARIRNGGLETEAADIVVYDKDGKESHRSPEFKWKPMAEKAEGKYGAMVFWDRAGKKVLFCAPLEKDPQTGIYDPETRQLRIVTGQLLAFGGTPIRPDSKGFLISEAQDKPGVAFVDWEGNKQKLEVDPEAIADNDRKGI